MHDLSKNQMSITLDRNLVTVSICCKDRYAAMELYDRLCANAREGLLELELPTAVPRA